jgi:hypothetical protein
MQGTHSAPDVAQRRGLREAVEAALADRQAAESYRRHQWEALKGRRRIASRAVPLEFDESGFPIVQQHPGFLTRVRRLLRDG